MAGATLTGRSRFMRHALHPEAIDVMAGKAQLGKAFQQVVIAFVAVGGMAAGAVLMFTHNTRRGFLAWVTLQADSGNLRRQQKSLVAGVGLVTGGALTGLERFMPPRNLPLRLKLRMAGSTGLGPFSFQESGPVAAVGIMAGSAAAVQKRSMQMGIFHGLTHTLMTVCAQIALSFKKQSGLGALMGLVAPQTAILVHGGMRIGRGRRCRVMALPAQAAGRGVQKGFPTGLSAMRRMAAETVPARYRAVSFCSARQRTSRLIELKGMTGETKGFFILAHQKGGITGMR